MVIFHDLLGPKIITAGGLRDTAGRGPAAAAELGQRAALSDGQRDADGAAGGGEAG